MNLNIDVDAGTMVLGSKFEMLQLAPRTEDAFVHSTIATLDYHDDWWLLANVHVGIVLYYANQIERRFGIELHTRTLWKPHVSIIRGKIPLANADKWGRNNGQRIKINYTHQVYTNGKHWWLNVECQQFSEITDFFSLPTNKNRFHLTIGRVKD